MTVFISGGCKNGKSTLAEKTAKTLAAGGPLYYVATMIPRDGEDRARIRRHVASRAGQGFTTLECGTQIEKCLLRADAGGTFLLDSVTALLANEMFRPDGTVDRTAPERVAQELARFAAGVKNAVFVSDFIDSDAGSYDALTEAYRRGLATVDRTLARVCDTAAEVCIGCSIVYKGVMPQ